MPESDFQALVQRLTYERIDYVHDYPQIDSLKFSIGESLFIKDSPIVTLYAPIWQSPVPKTWSTVAILYRGPFLKPLHALSGWGHQCKPESAHISGRLWTEEVYLVSDYVGHILEPDDERD